MRQLVSCSKTSNNRLFQHPVSHLIEVRHLHQRRSLLPLGYSITGSGKSVDVKAFKIAAFRSMRRQYAASALSRMAAWGQTANCLTTEPWSAVGSIADTTADQSIVPFGTVPADPAEYSRSSQPSNSMLGYASTAPQDCPE
jgi:hypothetical protein